MLPKEYRLSINSCDDTRPSFEHEVLSLTRTIGNIYNGSKNIKSNEYQSYFH